MPVVEDENVVTYSDNDLDEGLRGSQNSLAEIGNVTTFSGPGFEQRSPPQPQNNSLSFASATRSSSASPRLTPSPANDSPGQQSEQGRRTPSSPYRPHVYPKPNRKSSDTRATPEPKTKKKAAVPIPKPRFTTYIPDDVHRRYSRPEISLSGGGRSGGKSPKPRSLSLTPEAAGQTAKVLAKGEGWRAVSPMDGTKTPDSVESSEEPATIKLEFTGSLLSMLAETPTPSSTPSSPPDSRRSSTPDGATIKLKFQPLQGDQRTESPQPANISSFLDPNQTRLGDYSPIYNKTPPTFPQKYTPNFQPNQPHIDEHSELDLQAGGVPAPYQPGQGVGTESKQPQRRASYGDAPQKPIQIDFVRRYSSTIENSPGPVQNPLTGTLSRQSSTSSTQSSIFTYPREEAGTPTIKPTAAAAPQFQQNPLTGTLTKTGFSEPQGQPQVVTDSIPAYQGAQLYTKQYAEPQASVAKNVPQMASGVEEYGYSAPNIEQGVPRQSSTSTLDQQQSFSGQSSVSAGQQQQGSFSRQSSISTMDQSTLSRQSSAEARDPKRYTVKSSSVSVGKDLLRRRSKDNVPVLSRNPYEAIVADIEPVRITGSPATVPDFNTEEYRYVPGQKSAFIPYPHECPTERVISPLDEDLPPRGLQQYSFVSDDGKGHVKFEYQSSTEEKRVLAQTDRVEEQAYRTSWYDHSGDQQRAPQVLAQGGDAYQEGGQSYETYEQADQGYPQQGYEDYPEPPPGYQDPSLGYQAQSDQSLLYQQSAENYQDTLNGKRATKIVRAPPASQDFQQNNTYLNNGNGSSELDTDFSYQSDEGSLSEYVDLENYLANQIVLDKMARGETVPFSRPQIKPQYRPPPQPYNHPQQQNYQQMHYAAAGATPLQQVSGMEIKTAATNLKEPRLLPCLRLTPLSLSTSVSFCLRSAHTLVSSLPARQPPIHPRHPPASMEGITLGA